MFVFRKIQKFNNKKILNFNNKKSNLKNHNFINFNKIPIIIFEFFKLFRFLDSFGFLREQIPWDLNLTSNSNFNQIVICRLTRRLAESQGQGQAGAALHCIALQCRALLEVSPLGIKLRREILLFIKGATGGPPDPQGSFPGPWRALPGPWRALLSPWYRQYH